MTCTIIDFQEVKRQRIAAATGTQSKAFEAAMQAVQKYDELVKQPHANGRLPHHLQPAAIAEQENRN